MANPKCPKCQSASVIPAGAADEDLRCCKCGYRWPRPVPAERKRCGMCGHRGWGRARSRCPVCGAEWLVGVGPFVVSVDEACRCRSCVTWGSRGVVR